MSLVLSPLFIQDITSIIYKYYKSKFFNVDISWTAYFERQKISGPFDCTISVQDFIHQIIKNYDFIKYMTYKYMKKHIDCSIVSTVRWSTIIDECTTTNIISELKYSLQDRFLDLLQINNTDNTDNNQITYDHFELRYNNARVVFVNQIIFY